ISSIISQTLHRHPPPEPSLHEDGKSCIIGSRIFSNNWNAMTDLYMIVGLGNPGRDYEKTRHNIGFRCVDEIAAKHGLTFGKKQGKAVVAEGKIGEHKVLLVKPQTYMNLSGNSVRELVNFYKVPI